MCAAGYHGPRTTGTAAICEKCPGGTWSANGAIDSSECTSKSNQVHTVYHVKVRFIFVLKNCYADFFCFKGVINFKENPLLLAR